MTTLLIGSLTQSFANKQTTNLLSHLFCPQTCLQVETGTAGGVSKDNSTHPSDKGPHQQQQESAKPPLAHSRFKPKDPVLVLRGYCDTKGSKFRTFPISLAGLLDYDENDTQEDVFELSLFAEVFHEMLMKTYGGRIYQALTQRYAVSWWRGVGCQWLVWGTWRP